MNYWEESYQNFRSVSADYDGWLDKYAFLPGERILDLGCGAGTDLEKLLGCSADVSAADFSESAVSLVKAHFGENVKTACFDMRVGFPYPDSSFDTVVSDLSLHYFSAEETRRIVSELSRILRPGGRLIARVHSMENLPPDAVFISPGYYRAYGYDRRYFTADDVRSFFSAWQIPQLENTIARRYSCEKKVIEFTAIRM